MVAEDVAGLSSIIGQINREAVEAAEKITAKAKEDAKQIIKKEACCSLHCLRFLEVLPHIF